MVHKDEEILKYKSEIEKLEKKLVDCKWKPVTNCKIELFNKPYNLSVCNDVSFLMEIWNYYNQLFLTFKHFDNKDTLYNGFRLDEWLSDINLRIQYVDSKDKAKQLSVMKTKLENMLSDDKKAEIEFEAIIKQLNNLK